MTPDRMARITTKGFTVAVTKPPLALSWRGVWGFVTRGYAEKHTAGVLRWRP